MNIRDFLSPANVTVDVRASNKHQLLQELAQKAATTLNLPADQIATELLKREQLGSTGMGGGVAIPHARIGAVTKPFGILVKLRQPIDFDAVDGQPVDLAFMLLLSTADVGGQLGALAAVARRLRVAEVLGQSRRAKSASELYSAVAG